LKTLLAHVEKLEEEGKVARENGILKLAPNLAEGRP
jgi:hypothetical protein